MDGSELRYQFSAIAAPGSTGTTILSGYAVISRKMKLASLLTFNPDSSGKTGKIIIYGDWDLERKE